MLTLRKGGPERQGVWFDCPEKFTKYHKAFVSCPACNGTISLRGRKITEEGIVFPSVVCPHEPCSFHKYIQLEGWDKGAVERGVI